MNGFILPKPIQELQLTQDEERLIALRIPFMQVRALPRGKQHSLHGSVINVPSQIHETITQLPRHINSEGTVSVRLKRQIFAKNVYSTQNIRPLKVLEALNWLFQYSPLYNANEVNINCEWLNETISLLAQDGLVCDTNIGNNHNDSVVSQSEIDEVSHEVNDTLIHSINTEATGNQGIIASQCDDGHTSVSHACNNAGNENTESVHSDDSSSDDGFLEVGDTHNVPAMETLAEKELSDNHLDIAPGENSCPLYILADRNAEYLAFPTLYNGRNPYEGCNIGFADRCKFELRNVDRRIAKNITNLFFKYKQFQLKYKQRADSFLLKSGLTQNYAVRDVKHKEDRIKI